MQHREDIVFLFVGDGPRKKEVVAAKEADGLGNIVLMDYFPREQLHASLTVADVHLISMRREMTGIVVPCKLYGAMASGRPSLFVGPEHCETADTIRENGCGSTVRLGESSVLVDSLLAMADDPAACAERGGRGRKAFLREFERQGCCDRWARDDRRTRRRSQRPRNGWRSLDSRTSAEEPCRARALACPRGIVKMSIS